MNVIERRNRMQETYRKYSNRPTLRRLMHWGKAVAILCVLLILSGIWFIHKELWTGYHIVRGCAGVCGCALFAIAAVYYYRLNVMAMDDRDAWRHQDNTRKWLRK